MNLGNPHEVTINDLASTILTMVGRSRATGDWQVHVERRLLPLDDPCRRRPSIHRAQAMLGWEPKIPLGDGLRSTIEHFGKELGL
jgi:UDP-glucuronate decarboxylase